MSTEDNLGLTLSLAAIAAREAADLTSAATRVVEQCDDLIRDHLGRSQPVDSRVLSRLASIIGGQREVMSGLSANALVAVRLASKQLSAALGKVRATPPVDGAATEHEQAAGRLLAVLAQLERAITSSETQMRDVSGSVSQTARRAEQGRVFEGLMGRLLGRRSE